MVGYIKCSNIKWIIVCLYSGLIICSNMHQIEGFEKERSCTSDTDCELKNAGICQGGVCVQCVACEQEYNRTPGNDGSFCPPNTARNCGKCLPNYKTRINPSSPHDATVDDWRIKCTLIIESNDETSAHDRTKQDILRSSTAKQVQGIDYRDVYSEVTDINNNATFQNTTQEAMIVEDKNAPWLYIGLVVAFLLTFSGIGTWISWKYQPIIIEMKRLRRLTTNKYRQQSVDIRNASIREKQKMDESTS